jgi:pimeloyl-ACP methyl ester carboxylesterase
VTVPSSDGVDVTVHHLANHPGRQPLLISHATGFHGRAYLPLAVALGDNFDVWALDHRGHGATPAPDRWNVSWVEYGDDAEAAATWLAGQTTGAAGGLVGFGHSMGGATLLMAADRRPELFRLLVLFEPIVFPPQPATDDRESTPLVVGARRRRSTFDSLAAARANFASKPPMNGFVPAALDAYLDGAFAPVDPQQPDGPVRLLCDPALEAETFARAHHHPTWERLSAIAVPTVVIAGAGAEADGPASLAPLVAERLPNGRLELRKELEHFGPFAHPELVADIVRAEVSGDRDTPRVR